MTEFDSRAETVIVRAPSAAFPDDAIVGEEGGGQVSDPGGGPFVPATGCLLASNSRIHQAMLDELRASRR